MTLQLWLTTIFFQINQPRLSSVDTSTSCVCLPLPLGSSSSALTITSPRHWVSWYILYRRWRCWVWNASALLTRRLWLPHEHSTSLSSVSPAESFSPVLYLLLTLLTPHKYSLLATPLLHRRASQWVDCRLGIVSLLLCNVSLVAFFFLGLTDSVVILLSVVLCPFGEWYTS